LRWRLSLAAPSLTAIPNSTNFYSAELTAAFLMGANLPAET